MKHLPPLLLTLFSALSLAFGAPSIAIHGTEALETPALWPPDTWESLAITLTLSPLPEECLYLYGTLLLPDGQEAGLFSTPVSSTGEARLLLDGGRLRAYGQEGAYTLASFRLLTSQGFQELEGAYTTKDYTPTLFRPQCQSTLLTRRNGVEFSFHEGGASLSFTCPPDSTLLPEFFYQEDCVFDGFAVGLDYLCTSHLLPTDAPGLFLTPTYAGLDLSQEGFQALWNTGDKNGDFSPGETLSLSFPLEENLIPDEESLPVEDSLCLILFYHCLSHQMEETGMLAYHPFDTNQDLQISQEELDEGRVLWNTGEADSPLLLEAIGLCGALAYGYDAPSGRFFPIYP